MAGRLAAHNITTADSPTSVYRCRTAGYTAAMVNVCNRGAGPADITIIVSDTANISDLAGTIEFQTTVNSKGVLERTGIAVGSAQYITIISSSADISVVVMGVETGDDASSSISEIPIIIGTLTRTLINPMAKASGGEYFGSAVSLHGDNLIVGAKGNNASGYGNGQAMIYNVISGQLLHTLSFPGSNANNAVFGQSVGIGETYAIVGSGSANEGSDTFAGSVYIYNVASGVLEHTIASPTTYGTNNDLFGEVVAIDGNYAVAGAKNEDDASNANTGIAYIINASTGAVAHTLANPVSGANAYFGKSVAVSGTNVVVGASGYTAGAVYIFSAITGSLIRTISNPQGASNNHEFGHSVAIDGNYLVVGALLEDVSGVANTGRAYVFNVTSGALVHTLDNPNVYGTGESDQYGHAVAISGDRLIVGSRREDDAGGTSSGVAYVYSVSTGTLLKTLTNPNQVGTSENDYFGWSCAINSNRMAIGAMGENQDLAPYYQANHGRTYVFGVS